MALFGIFGKPDVEKLKANNDVGGLVKALGYAKDNDVRCLAAEALGKTRDPSAVEALINALKDKDCIVRMNAARVLGETRDPRAMEPLINALKGENSDVAWYASDALVKIGRPAEWLLINMAKDEHARGVIGKATSTLYKMGIIIEEFIKNVK